ncbi:hypothetical protein [Loigolactobacillus zhaoyuanensis]|uniref:DUF2187 domain-containing protein n=1 Tax=Loigolactobacillus zhaoyuanensis TaxID=2486017 RepID=A0ABW8UI25_9LACO|nr:hypothetical protein [Loigolactobacillus zhaoyuanensis]
MDNILTIKLANGQTLTLNEVSTVAVTTNDAVIETTSHDFLNIGRAVRYDITYDGSQHKIFAAKDVISADLVEK